MSGRRTDTRQRIMDVALELFSVQGYDKTSLREIAERLGVTKAALYYHYPTKEDILIAIVADLGAAIDEFVAWSRKLPRTPRARRAVLARLAEFVRGQWGPRIRFLQDNQFAVRDLGVGENLSGRIQGLFGMLHRPEDDVYEQTRGSLAILAVYFANLPAQVSQVLLGIKATDEELASAAMEVAVELVSRRRRSPSRASARFQPCL